MKYVLKEVNPSECTCGKTYQLVEDNDGYDLIQLKRGLQEDISSLTLYPGEPAFVLDTGRLYIGNAEGIPVLINGGSTGTSGLATIGDFEDNSLIVVPYAKMITANGSTPTKADAGNYLVISVLNEDRKPIGEGLLTNWNFTSDSAQFKYGSYVTANAVTKIIYNQTAATKKWVIEIEELEEENIISLRVKDKDGNIVIPTWSQTGPTEITLDFEVDFSGTAFIYLK